MYTSGEPTYRVSDLCGEIREITREAFASLWIAGEVQRPRPSQRGHFYFELVEKGRGDEIVAKLDAVIWSADFARIRAQLAATGQKITEGLEIRCRCGLDFWPPGGRLQLVVREVDPVFTLGLLEQRRRQTLEALSRAGLLDLNRGHALPPLPLRIGLVTSEGSAAYHDFLSTLAESGYGFQVLFVHAAMQGKDSEREIATALALLGDRGIAAGLDCLVLIRGGGSRTDLAAFDSRRVAEAVARSPLPVLTGLGHEIDQSIADRVAHTALKTPTKVAELLIEEVAGMDAAVEDLRRRLCREAREPLRAALEVLERAERRLHLARMRLGSAASRLDEMARLLVRLAQGRLRDGRRRSGEARLRLLRTAPRLLERRAHLPQQVGRRLVAAGRARLAARRATLDGHARLLTQLAPQRTLERGFSITRDAAGRLLRSAADARPGAAITTRLATGTLHSRVESTE